MAAEAASPSVRALGWRCISPAVVGPGPLHGMCGSLPADPYQSSASCPFCVQICPRTTAHPTLPTPPQPLPQEDLPRAASHPACRGHLHQRAHRRRHSARSGPGPAGRRLAGCCHPGRRPGTRGRAHAGAHPGFADGCGGEGPDGAAGPPGGAGRRARVRQPACGGGGAVAAAAGAGLRALYELRPHLAPGLLPIVDLQQQKHVKLMARGKQESCLQVHAGHGGLCPWRRFTWRPGHACQARHPALICHAGRQLLRWVGQWARWHSVLQGWG